MGEIVGVGLCVLDEIYVVDDFSFAAPRTRYRERVECPGGMVSTALAQAAALGCPAHLHSMVGDDVPGHRLRDALAALGVGVCGVVASDRFPTSVAVVLVHAETGERRFLVTDRRAIEAEAPLFDLSGIRENTVLLVDGHFSDQALRAAKRARAIGARVVGDFSDTRESFMRLLPWVDHAIVPEEFVQAFGAGGPEATLRALHEKFGGEPVVTLGARGALAWVDGDPLRIAPVEARVRDTTGAGDVFHGAFAAGLCRGFAVPEALALAARAAARCCTGLGGTGRLLSEAELLGRSEP